MSSGTISPDGKWLWSGSEWIPAPPSASQEAIEDARPTIEEAVQGTNVEQEALAKQAVHFDLNQDGVLQPSEIQMSLNSIANPPTSPPPISTPPHFSAPHVPEWPSNADLPGLESSSRRLGAFLIAGLLLSSGILVAVWLTSNVYSPLQTVRDSDGDGFADAYDTFPFNDEQWSDSDNDGYGDNPTGTEGDAFPDNPSQNSDSDGDGYGDNQSQGATQIDAFPMDESEWLDSDEDGHGDNSDAFPLDESEWLDSDGDGYGDNSDAFPLDGSEWLDSDGDGYGDNTDVCVFVAGTSTQDRLGCHDSDNDGWSDEGDAFPNDASEHADSDGDGVGNNADLSNLGNAVLYFSNVILTASSSQDYDFGSAPDMYLIAELDLACDGTYESSKISQTVWNDYSVTTSNDIYLYIDIPDHTTNLCFRLYVYDEDDSYDDILDYNDNPDYTSMSWQRNVYRGFSMNIEESSTDYKPVSIDIEVSIAYTAD